MKIEEILNQCLSGERIPLSEIYRQSGYFSDINFFKKMIDSISDIVLILNENRQIVLSNKVLFERFALNEESVYGYRPGETLGCIYALKSENGCGTVEYCKACGAAKAIYSTQQNKTDIQECHIIRKENLGSLDLRIKAIPLSVHKEGFTIFIISDISHEKRRRSLEQIFFHDIMNLAGSIRGLSELLPITTPEKRKEYEKLLLRNSDFLIQEINAHKMLTNAENGELSVHVSLIDSREILEELVNIYKYQRIADKRNIRIDSSAIQTSFSSDRTLLLRVLGNMIKNAFESSGEDETITVGCEIKEERIQFWVHNPGVIPEHVQLQIFQRSFSTKSKDRGLGTYGMMLLSERYLKGRVSFTSCHEKGTVFKASYPMSLNSDACEND